MKSFIIIILSMLAISGNIRTLYAHAPHDAIADILCMNTSEGLRILTIVRGNLFLSTDGKNFDRIVHGLDNTGLLNHLEYSPHEKGYILLSTNSDGIYFSADLGESWQKRNNGLKNRNIDLIEISGTKPGLVIATGGESGLFISFNWGAEWSHVKGLSNKITSVKFVSDHIFLSDVMGKIFSLDASDLSLKLLYSLPIEYGPIFTMAISPFLNKTGEVLIGTRLGLFAISLKQQKIIRKFDELPSGKVTGITYSEDFPSNNKIYALFGDEGFFTSVDNGKNWRKLNRGLSTDKQAKAFKEPNYYSFRVFHRNDREWIFICGFDGLFKSENFGKHWTQLNTLSENLIVGLDISDNYHLDSTLAYITYLNGPVVGVSKGDKWESLFAKGLILDNLIGQGIIRLMDLTFYPDAQRGIIAISRMNIYQFNRLNNLWTNMHLFQSSSRIIRKVKNVLKWEEEESASLIEKIDSRHLIITTTSGKIFIYSPENNSKTFVAAVNNSIVSVVVSPNYESDSTIYIGTANEGLFRVCGKIVNKLGFQGTNHIQVAISPQLTKDSTLFIATYCGLYKSNNYGGTWSLLKVSDFPQISYISAIAVSPNYYSDSTILITLKGYGLFRSENGGKSFRPIARDLIKNNNLFASLENFPAISGIIEFSPEYKIDSTVFAISDCSVFRSEDRGESWTKLPHYEISIEKDFLSILRGALFDLKYDLILLVVCLIGALFLFNKMKHFRWAKIKIS